MPTKGTITDRVKKMKKLDLEKLSRYNTYQQIGEMFYVSVATVKTELQSQIDNKTFYKNTLLGVEEYEDMLMIKEDTCGGGFGQWMDSGIRLFGKSTNNEK
jgi:hypothetical protein